MEEVKKLSPQDEDVQEERIKMARIALVRRHFIWLGDAIMALRLHKTYEVPTMGVDVYWRCYWNPTTVSTWTDAEIAGVLVHEAMHLLRRHAKRALPIHDVWNIAGDLEINDDIVSDRNPNVQLPKNCCFPKKFGCKNDLIAEEYYDFLLKTKVKIETQPMGGSGSDGQRRPWEIGIKGEEGNDAISEEEGNLIRTKVAEKVKNQDPGNISAGMKRWAEEELTVKVDWRKQVRGVISTSLDKIRGSLFKSFQQISRRSQDLIFPGPVSPNPKILCIIDTSGSMGEKQLAQCVAEVKGVLRVVQNNVTYVTGDTEACAKGTVRNHKQIKLEGGGGTDMGAIIREHHKGYNLIIVLTDGYTPWCEQVPCKVVACIINEGNFEYTPPPEWIQTVYVNDV